MCVYVHMRTSYLASAGHTRHGGIPTNVYDIVSVYMCVYVHMHTSYLASAGHTRHGGIPTNVYDIFVCVYVCVCTHAYILLGKCWSHKTRWNTDKCV